MKKIQNVLKILLAFSLIIGLCAAFTSGGNSTALAAGASGSLINEEELFTSRDLEQQPDLTDAVEMPVSSGSLISITEAGVYHLTGSGSEVLILVDAPDDAKVQLVLDGVNITNTNVPCIYVRSADKVFVTTVADSYLTVTGAFTTDGDVNTDGVIFSRDDLTLNGTAVLNVTSSEHGIVSKDDLKVTGGTYIITANSHAIEGKDSVRIADGIFTLSAGKDGVHAENDEDPTLGYLYIGGGSFTVTAGDDGIHAESVIEIDGGTFAISAAEGIEGTYIQINDGSISIQSWDDGINAAQKSSAYRATLEINGGEITVVMGAGDTDAIDANGDLIITGGSINVSGNSSFDIDGSIQFTGGTVIVNGQQVTSIPNQMMGGRGGWGFGGGDFGGWNGQNGQQSQNGQQGQNNESGQSPWGAQNGQGNPGGWGGPGGHRGW